jgi:undecaprenyl-diphosphatase
VSWGWLLGALVVAGVLLARRHALARGLQVAGWAGVAAAAAVGVGLIPLPNLEQLIEDLGEALGTWTYLLVGVLAFLETGAFVGLIAPGETTVIVGGVIAGQGRISLLVLIAVTWVAAVCGDLASYTLGRKLGRAWLVRHGPRVKITEERLEQVEAFFERRGGVTILVGRFVGFVRAVAPFVAGASKMPLRKFLPYDVLGAGAWATTFCVLGYLFWRSFDRLTEYVSRGLLAFGTVVAVVVVLVGLVQLRRDPAKRARARAWLDRQAEHPLARPLVRLAGPAWRRVGRPAASGADSAARFGHGRLTPGDLGLELTTLLALTAVGSFAFVLLGDLVGGPRAPRIDVWAADGAARVTTDALVDVARVVTELGSLPVTAAVAAATAAWALVRRRPIDAVALAAGVVLAVAAVHVAKAAYGRDRPVGMLVPAALEAYPSGHTAYAVTLVACAVVLVRGGVGWAARFAAVSVAVAAVVVVGFTRVYLRVHFLTDVLGGAALTVALWSAIGALALVAGHVRHNGRRS